MSIETTIHLNIDFYDDGYTLIRAKQGDDSSRWITVACYNQGEFFRLSESKYSVYVRYKKPNGYGGINSARINARGEALIELTYDMLSKAGICTIDLIVADKGSAIINVNTGEISYISSASILSTLKFQIDVSEAAIDNSIMEDLPEYTCFVEAIETAEANFNEVVLAAKSWAVGDTGLTGRDNEDEDNSKYYSKMSRSYAVGDTNGIRTGEDTDNSKYYCEEAGKSAEAADGSEANALTYMNNAESYKDSAYAYAVESRRYAVGGTGTVDGEDIDNSKYYCEQAFESANNADESETASKGYAESSEKNMNAASASASAASASEVNASTSASNASVSAANAATSESNAANSANDAEKYATTAMEAASNITENVNIASEAATLASNSAILAGESADIATTNAGLASDSADAANISANAALTSATSASASETNAANSASEAHTYYIQVEEITTGLSGAFIPRGTIEFAELVTLLASGDVQAGYLYNISDNFTTDATFAKGEGIECAAGTNVYMTSNGVWDCLASTTVSGIKGDKETEYRQGNVNITVENIGAISSDDIAAIDEVTSYLGI